jgi:NTE family protein
MKGMITLLLICLSSVYFSQYKNLVLEGGGVRGIAYVGAIQAFEEANLLHDFENVSGTSVGAISAAFICIGYTSTELKRELSSLKIQHFNDGKGIFVGGIHRTNNRYGWYRGEKLTSWINELIFKKTGIENLTFGQLHELAETDDSYKNLFVSVTNLSQQAAQVISFENYPDMRIADGIRISASIPLYYSAMFIDSVGNVYNKPPKNIAVDVMVDGGFISNYPIHVFDDRFEMNETIGLRLDEAKQIAEDTSGKHQLAPYEINDLKDYIGAFYNLVIENLNRHDLTDEDWRRTVSISTCGIGPKVKKLANEEIDLLINSGYQSVKNYLSNSESFY